MTPATIEFDETLTLPKATTLITAHLWGAQRLSNAPVDLSRPLHAVTDGRDVTDIDGMLGFWLSQLANSLFDFYFRLALLAPGVAALTPAVIVAAASKTQH
ncbi:hypothetical protein C8R44DRAFT_988197 [Mycena epipterygia]|nr:hypothetical protein C8R44DRAFT_988197 [Mycena epipterygia]